MHRLNLGPRVPNAPKTGSTRSIPPQETFPEFPRSRDSADPPPASASNIDPAPATLAPQPSAVFAAVRQKVAVRDSAVDRLAPRPPLRRVPRDPAAPARSFASSARGYVRRERSTLADCPLVAPAASAGTVPERRPAQFLRRAPPSIRSKGHTEAIGSDIRQKVE